jgi:hypothetical protein
LGRAFDRFLISGRNPKAYLHDKPDRKPQFSTAEDYQQQKRFNSDESLEKMVYMKIEKILEKWGNVPIPNWSGILSQLMIYFEDQITAGRNEYPKTYEITQKTLQACLFFLHFFPLNNTSRPQAYSAHISMRRLLPTFT